MTLPFVGPQEASLDQILLDRASSGDTVRPDSLKGVKPGIYATAPALGYNSKTYIP